jgi:hypothetical protein
MSTVLPETYKKYGYKMFDCSAEEIKKYNHECYSIKKMPTPSTTFSYVTFSNVEDAIERINSIFIPAHHGDLPEIKWSLSESNNLLIKEIWFYTVEDQKLYQCAVERAWALGGHLDSRVEQYYYD